MLRDPPWPRALLPTYMDGRATGSHWYMLFWFLRHPHYERVPGMPHSRLSDRQHRKWFEKFRHMVLNEELVNLHHELPWMSYP